MLLLLAAFLSEDPLPPESPEPASELEPESELPPEVEPELSELLEPFFDDRPPFL